MSSFGRAFVTDQIQKSRTHLLIIIANVQYWTESDLGGV